MKFIKLYEDTILPMRGTENSPAYDFFAAETVRIEPNGVAVVPTGISFEGMPTDQFLQLSLRGSISLHRPFLLANGVQIVGSDDEGLEIGIILYNRSNKIPAVVDRGEKIAQGILLNYHTIGSKKKPTKKKKDGYSSTDEKTTNE